MSRLFYDDEFQALRDVIEMGKGYQKTSGHLWPGMKPESAYAKLKACTQERGDQRLKFREIIAVMVFNGQFDALYFMCDETMHHRPQPKTPEDEEAKVVAVIDNAATTLSQALKALETMKNRQGMRGAA